MLNPIMMKNYSKKYMLDGINGIAGAWSFKKIKKNAIKTIRVRRSSDNEEADISFTNGLLNVSSLLTFCGANSGYLTKIYDQSGNGNDATQTTAAYQPRIVNAGK